MLLSLVMNQMNGVKVPKVTNIAGFEVTHSTPARPLQVVREKTRSHPGRAGRSSAVPPVGWLLTLAKWPGD